MHWQAVSLERDRKNKVHESRFVVEKMLLIIGIPRGHVRDNNLHKNIGILCLQVFPCDFLYASDICPSARINADDIIYFNEVWDLNN